MSEGLKKYWREVKKLARDEGIPVIEARMLWRSKKDERKRKKKHGDLDLQVKEILDAQEEMDASGVLCPYCRCGFAPSDKTITCKKCQTTYHKECARELKKCGTLGCGKKLKKGRTSGPVETMSIVIRPTDIEQDHIEADEETFFDTMLDQVTDTDNMFSLIQGIAVMSGIIGLIVYCVWITIDAIMKSL